MKKQKNFYGLTKGEDGLYHSEYGDTFTEKDLRTGPWPAVMVLVAFAALVACAVGAGVKTVVKACKKDPAITQKQPTNPATAKAVQFVEKER